MLLKTKYEIGQRVYFFKNNQLVCDDIVFIVGHLGRWKDEPMEVEYALKAQFKDYHNPVLHNEKALFASKEEAAQHVLSIEPPLEKA